MSNYLEVNSTYRDRNTWREPAQFDIPISQTGTKNKLDAVDPVCLSEPITEWTSNQLNNDFVSPTYKITGTIYDEGQFQFTSNESSFVIFSENLMNSKENYFRGLVFVTGTQTSRINSYLFLGSTIAPHTVGYLALISVDTPISPLTLGATFSIEDPTDFSNTVPILFVPAGRTQANSYSNYYIYNESLNQFSSVTFYNNIHAIISFETTTFTTTWISSNSFSIRKELPTSPPPNSTAIQPIVTSMSNLSTITAPDLFNYSRIPDFYKNYYLRMLPYKYNEQNDNSGSQSRRILTSTFIENGGPAGIDIIVFTVYPEYDASIVILSNDYTIEILQFSYDNLNPFIYTGTLINQSSCYEFELINLILPNQILSVGNGTKIAFYPFVYVELSNISASSSGSTNLIYSNNPHATKMLFRVPIYDIQDPNSTPFVRLVSANMTQIIKFKPNDNLLFSVRLPNGQVYNTIIPEFYSPSVPNDAIQISALFRYKRI